MSYMIRGKMSRDFSQQIFKKKILKNKKKFFLDELIVRLQFDRSSRSDR